MRPSVPPKRWLVRFGYDGAGFAGWARQPGLRTIESEIRDGSVRCGLTDDPEGLRLEVASRTDRGVHARANALALSTSVPGPALLRALNGIAPEIWFERAAPVPEGFRVRSARLRWYRYFEPSKDQDLPKWRAAADCFQGPIDARSFSRGLPKETPAVRPVEAVSVTRVGGWLRIDVRAPSFVWGMVRKMVSAMRGVAAGTIPLDDLRAAVAGRSLLSLPLAEPERLVLWEVVHGVPWTERAEIPTRRQGVHFADERNRAAVRARVLAVLDPTRGRRPTHR